MGKIKYKDIMKNKTLKEYEKKVIQPEAPKVVVDIAPGTECVRVNGLEKCYND